jgi:phosphatidylglycerophosphate synthase
MSSNISFKDSLKSWDTENFLDRIFYRPVGFKIALLLKSTPVTPNLVTIISIFVGVFGCALFYYDDLVINLIGFAILVFANILDCVDGQLARITGIKSRIGRILDGFCGDIWFLTFYIAFCLRLINFSDSVISSTGFEWGWWVFLIALLSAYSHFNQAAMVDYYKTFHLHMLKGGRNSEFETAASVGDKFKLMDWKKEPISKLFTKLYHVYTLNQESRTPELKKYAIALNDKYPDGYPEEKIAGFRAMSLKLMPLLDSFTFNTRSIIILVSLLVDMPWLYFVFEILIFNILLYVAIGRHEKMCQTLNNE